jgi:hypothetical protein
LAELRGRGFSVFAEADGIRVNPASKLTDDDRRFIRAHKADIVAALRTEATAKSAEDITADSATDSRPLPPKGATIYCQDERGRPTGPETAWIWTWAGADRWHYAKQHPVPAGHAVDGTRW